MRGSQHSRGTPAGGLLLERPANGARRSWSLRPWRRRASPCRSGGPGRRPSSLPDAGAPRGARRPASSSAPGSAGDERRTRRLAPASRGRRSGLRDVGDVGPAEEGQQVVRADRVERDVGHRDHPLVALGVRERAQLGGPRRREGPRTARGRTARGGARSPRGSGPACRGPGSRTPPGSARRPARARARPAVTRRRRRAGRRRLRPECRSRRSGPPIPTPHGPGSWSWSLSSALTESTAGRG